MLPDRVSNPGPLTYESGALPIALRGPALFRQSIVSFQGSPLVERIHIPYYFGYKNNKKI